MIFYYENAKYMQKKSIKNKHCFLSNIWKLHFKNYIINIQF